MDNIKVDFPAHARTAHNSLLQKRLEENLLSHLSCSLKDPTTFEKMHYSTVCLYWHVSTHNADRMGHDVGTMHHTHFPVESLLTHMWHNKTISTLRKTHTHVHALMHGCVHAPARTYICTCARTHACMHTHAHAHTHTHVCMHTHTCIMCTSWVWF